MSRFRLIGLFTIPARTPQPEDLSRIGTITMVAHIQSRAAVEDVAEVQAGAEAAAAEVGLVEGVEANALLLALRRSRSPSSR